DAEELLKGELLELYSEIAQTKNEMRHLEQQQEVSVNRKARLLEEEQKLTATLRQLEANAHKLEKQLVEINNELEKQRTKMLTEGNQARVVHAELEQLVGTLRQQEQRLDQSMSRRDTMKDMQEAMDGFMLGVKEILKASRRPNSNISGVHGAVAELITVPQKLEVAVETALGGAMQHIV